MKWSKSQVLTFIRDGGGSMDWHPFVETDSLDFLKELEDEGLVTEAPSSEGGGILITITEKGLQWVRDNPWLPPKVPETAGK
jgi:DNA-binding PadR family transcriptional regulator